MKDAIKREQNDACANHAEREQAQPEVKHSAAKFMHYAEGRLIKTSEKFRKRYFAMRDKRKREKTPPLTPPLEGAGNTEGEDPALEQAGNNPSDNPSVDSNSCNSSDSCSQTRPEAEVCDISAICVTEELNAGQQAVLGADAEDRGMLSYVVCRDDGRRC